MNLTNKKYLLILMVGILIILSVIFIWNISDTVNTVKPEIKDTYSIVVYGGEPEGVMAAVAAARENKNTPILIIMKREKPGGLMTYGGLNYLDLNYDSKGEIINQGLFSEWYSKMGKNIGFSIEKATTVFSEMLNNERNLTIINECDLIDVNSEKDCINSLKIKYKGNIRKIKADKFIDASQDADLAIEAGVNYFNGGADRGLPEHQMAVTLVLHMDNINWENLKKEAQRDKFGITHINENHAWGFAKIGKIYQPQKKNIKLRGLNIVRFNKSEVYINGMLIFGVNPTNEKSLEQAYNSGKKEAHSVLKFLRNNVQGFINAKLMELPEELYVRESRHIISEHQLSTSDQFANKIFWDTIALGAYPLDYQASVPEYNGFVLFNPNMYGIPLRSLIPDDFTNLLVVGRSGGYSSLAAASSRVLPTGMATGEAAGKTAVIAEKNGTNFQEFSKNEKLIDKLQGKLFPNKDIKPKKNNIIEDRQVLPHLKNLLSWGLVIGGYNNNFKLQKSINEKEFSYILIKGLQRRKSPILYEWVPGSLETLSKKRTGLTLNRMAMLMLAATSHRVLDMDPKIYYKLACKEGLIPQYIQNNVDQNEVLTHREAYISISKFLNKYPVSDQMRKLRGVE